MNRIMFAGGAMLVSISASAFAEPLNTGYNHGLPGPYPVGAADNYWIKIASYEPPSSGNTVVPVGPAWVVAPPTAWTPVPGAQYISPRQTIFSSSGTSPARPAYSIYRKCFCLLPGFANPRLEFRARGDDNMQIWFNSMRNTLVAPGAGNFNVNDGPVYHRVTTNMAHFRAGRNCLYVLIEDNVAFGATGFSLAGTITAAGLMPGAAFGPEGRFGNCGCPGETTPGGAAPEAATAANDTEMVRAIVQFAESRDLRGSATSRADPGAAAGSALGR